MLEFLTTKQLGMTFMMTLYMYILGKPFPILIPVLYIVNLIMPELFTEGALALVGTYFSQFAYVIYFGFAIYFIPTRDIEPYDPKLNEMDFFWLNVWSIIIYFIGNHMLLFILLPVALEYLMGYIFFCSTCTNDL